MNRYAQIKATMSDERYNHLLGIAQKQTTKKLLELSEIYRTNGRLDIAWVIANELAYRLG